MNPWLGDLWPYLLVILVGFLPTEIWRSAAVLLARGVNEESEALVLVRAVATAMVAAVIARFVLTPTGDLAALPLWIRAGACVAGLGVYLYVYRSVIVGVIVGETVIIAGAWWAH